MKSRLTRFKISNVNEVTHQLIKDSTGIVSLYKWKFGNYPEEIHVFSLKELKKLRDWLTKCIDFLERP